jgi:hypothetical protein
MSISLDDLTADRGFTAGGKTGGQATFLPEPERRPRRYTVISVDDHIVEPPDTFEGRMPAALTDRAPHIVGLTPAEVLKRNFWFCAVEDPSSFVQRERIGVENILLESDYPHCDSTWPDTQETIHNEIGSLPPADIRRITWQNAAELYRHEVPAAVQDNPDAF